MDEEPEIFEAIDNNDIEKVKKILRYGENVNIRGMVYGGEYEGLTPLNMAYSLKRFEIVKLLLAYPKININLKDTYGDTILYLVSKFYNREITKLVLENPKININVKGEYDNTPLQDACYYGNIELVKLLLARPEIDINSRDFWKKTALTNACISNNIEIVKLLLSRPEIDVTLKVKKYSDKIDINKNINSINLLCYVCQMGYEEIVKLLLQNPKIIIDYDEFTKFPKAKSIFKKYSKNNIDKILDSIEN